jgi:hypothetical protein
MVWRSAMGASRSLRSRAVGGIPGGPRRCAGGDATPARGAQSRQPPDCQALHCRILHRIRRRSSINGTRRGAQPVQAWPTRSPASAWVDLEAGHHVGEAGLFATVWRARSARDRERSTISGGARNCFSRPGSPGRRRRLSRDWAPALAQCPITRAMVAICGYRVRRAGCSDRALRLASGLRIRRLLILHTREVAGSKPAAPTLERPATAGFSVPEGAARVADILIARQMLPAGRR